MSNAVLQKKCVWTIITWTLRGSSFTAILYSLEGQSKSATVRSIYWGLMALQNIVAYIYDSTLIIKKKIIGCFSFQFPEDL